MLSPLLTLPLALVTVADRYDAVTNDLSVRSRSVKVMEPLSVRYAPFSVAVVLGLLAIVVPSSVTAPATSVAIIVGVSLLPVIVTVTVEVVAVASLPLAPLLSVAVMV